MFLLKPVIPEFLPHSLSFTFHNVSIKTAVCANVRIQYIALHSTMFLLKPASTAVDAVVLTALHSTMFLLKRNAFFSESVADLPLHSTMFLLKLNDARSPETFLILYIPQCFY